MPEVILTALPDASKAAISLPGKECAYRPDPASASAVRRNHEQQDRL